MFIALFDPEHMIIDPEFMVVLMVVSPTQKYISELTKSRLFQFVGRLEPLDTCIEIDIVYWWPFLILAQ